MTLHVGAMVYVQQPSGLYPTHVARLTPCQVLTDCGRRFWRNDGRVVGGGTLSLVVQSVASDARYRRERDERAQRRAAAMGYTQEVAS